MILLENSIYPHANKTSRINSLQNLTFTYYHMLKFFQKCSGFVDVTLKFGMAILSRAEIFAKIK